jgi:von Willebrand factor type A C-terminal domain/von Willebrand factor type A domain
MSSGPTLERDPARAGSDADRGTQLGSVTRLLTRVLTAGFLLRGAVGRLLGWILTAVLLLFWPLVFLQRIAHAIGRALSAIVTVIEAAVESLAQGLLRVIRACVAPLAWAGRLLGGVAQALLSALGAILAPLVRAARLLLLLARELLTVMLLPLVALGRVVARIASVLWLVAARVGRALMSFSQTLLRAVRAVLAPFIQACRRVGELLHRLGAWFAALLRRSTLSRVIALGILLAALVITAIAAPSEHSASYPVFAVIEVVLATPLAIGLLVLAVRLLVLVVRFLVLVVRFLAWPLIALAKLVRRAAAPLVALLERVPELVNRVEHSVLLASRKATFQATTRSLQAPILALGGTGLAVPATGPHMPFRAELYQNEYLPGGGVEVNAIVTVTAGNGDWPLTDGAGGSVDDAQPSAAEAAEVILLDCSGSMAYPLAKLREAQRATAAAIDSLRDGTWFALVRATERAELAYPPAGGLAQASPETRRAAKHAVQLLWPEGGTAMGQWLTLARDLLASRPSAIAHAILLTDGSNESESRDSLEFALAECAGRFQCDCRGVGTDWRVKELRMIASRLLGTVDIVAEPADLQADFQAMIEQAMGKATGDVSLRLWTPQGATVAFLKQVAPTIEDLTDRSSTVDALTVDYPTGAWGDESRDYHLCVRVPAKEIGDELLAARVSMVVAGHVASQALVKAIWTDDEQLSTRINREVAHYTGQAELADAIQDGLEARKQGDEHTATFKLGRAVQLAAVAGNSDTMKLLAGVVDVQDAHTGTVRLKRSVQDADEMALDTRSTKTVRVQAPGP